MALTNDPNLRRQYLVEVSYYDEQAGTLAWEYLGTRDVVLDAADPTAPNRIYEGRVTSPLQIQRELFADQTIGGRALPSYGGIEVANDSELLTSGRLAKWRAGGFDGRQVRVLQGVAGATLYADHTVLLDGAGAGGNVFGLRTITLQIADRLQRLGTDLQTATYSGAGGFNGGADLKGKVRPDLFGQCRGVEPVPVDPANLWYDLAYSGLHSVQGVWDGGAALSASGSNPPPGGSYYVDTANGRIRLGTTPTNRLTADAIGLFGLRRNLILYSRQFENGAWQRTGLQTVTANAAAAPDGSLTMDKLVEDSANSSHRVFQGFTSTVGPWETSVYAKAAENNRLFVGSWDTVAENGALFDLAAGTVVSADAGVTAEIRPAGNGIYRCSVVRTLTTASPSASISLYMMAHGAYVGTAGNGLYVWDAQARPKATNDYADIETAGTVAAQAASAATLCEALARDRQGFTASEIDLVGLVSLDRDNAAVLGLSAAQPLAGMDALDQVINSIGGFYGAARTGALTVGRVDDPSATASTDAAIKLVIDDTDLEKSSFQFRPEAVPPYRIELGCRRNWTPCTADQIVGSATAAQRAFMLEEYRVEAAERTATKTKHPTASVFRRDTLLDSISDAATEALRLRDLFCVHRDMVTLTLQTQPFTLELNDEVWVSSELYAIDQAFRVIGIDENARDSRVTLTLWG